MFVGVPYSEHGKLSRIVDLDIDIGADAVDYKYVVLLEDSLSIKTLFLVLLQTKNHYPRSRLRCASWKVS